MASYPYKPLNVQSNDIRILRFLDSLCLQQYDRRDLVHCSLHHVPLDDVSVDFEAFSEEMEALASELPTRPYITCSWISRELSASEEGDNFTHPSIAHWRIERGSRDSVAHVVGIDLSMREKPM